MTEREIKNLQYEIGRLREENCRLEKENSDLENKYMKMYKDADEKICELNDEIERLRAKCVNISCEECNSHNIGKLGSVIIEFQDQHRQDCIRYNDMRTAFLKAVDELAMLRK